MHDLASLAREADMSEINWKDLFYVNPTTGEVSEEQTDGFVIASPTWRCV